MSNAVVTDWPSGSANTGWPQEPSAMLMPGRVEGWPAGTQRAANAAQRLLSQAVAWWDVEQYREGDRFLRNRGTGGELLDLRLGSSIVANSNDPRFLAPEDQGYVYLPGTTSDNLSTPDENALDITGDIDIRIKMSMDNWKPSVVSGIFTKYEASGGSNSWMLLVETNGTLRFSWTADGSTAIARYSTVGTGLVDGAVKWIRATLDVDNGSGGHDVKFYVSDDGVSWVQLGSTVTTAGTASINAGTSPVRIGASAASSGRSAMSVYRAIVKDGIDGTTVLDIDCDAITSGSATSFTAVTNQTVTVNRSTSGRKSVCVPSRHKGGKPVMLLGSDDFLEVQDNWQHGLLNFAQGDSFTVTIAHRQWNNALNSGLIVKRTITGADTSPGWYLATYTQSGGVNRVGAGLGDGTFAAGGAVFPATTGWTNGVLNLHALVVDRASNSLSMALNGGPATNIAVSSVGSGITSNVTRIGATSPTIGNYATMEFYGAAIFRRALSPAEITLLSNYFTGRIA